MDLRGSRRRSLSCYMPSVRVAQAEELVGVWLGCGPLVSVPKAKIMGMFDTG